MHQSQNDVIDEQGYRANIGMVITNGRGQCLLAKRIGKDHWQFPQGGMVRGESAQETLYREAEEEVGLRAEQLHLIAETKEWLHYRIPLWRRRGSGDCIGQKQLWFLLELLVPDSEVDIQHAAQIAGEVEFDDWRWVEPVEAIDSVVWFKKPIYSQVLERFKLI